MKERFDKLTQIWGGLTSSRKLGLIAAVVGIVAISAGILSWSGGSGEMKRLVSGGDAKDMGEVVDYLKSNQIEFEYSESGDTILVPEDKHASVKMEMAMKGLPKTGNVGYEIFDEGNFGISDFVQRTNKQRAIQGELERTIRAMDAVRDARVTIVQKDNNLLLSEDPENRPTASVMINTGGMRLPTEKVMAIQFLVARSVEGVGQ